MTEPRRLGAGCLVAALALWCYAWAAEDSVAASIARIKAVGKEGSNNAQASAAWKELIRVGPPALPALLAALDDADATAANWLRTAIDAIADREAKGQRPLPAKELEAFVAERHAGIARRLAYELLTRADATAPTRLLPGMLKDPSPELRRDAVARVLEQAEAAQKKGDQAAAQTAYRKAFDAALDRDQVDACVKQLQTLGEKVDVADHFGFIRQWLLLGPFDNRDGVGFNKAYSPENNLDPGATYVGKGDAKLSWVKHSTDDPYGMVDLNKAVGKHMGAAAYALALVDSTVARPVEIRAGSNNGIKIFLNGEELFGREEYHHGLRMDQHVGRGILKAGRNLVLVKVCQNEQKEDWAQGWSFQLRICDAIGAPAPLTLGTHGARADAPATGAQSKEKLLLAPVPFRVYQRDGNGRADIPVTLDPSLKDATIVSAHLSGVLTGGNISFADGKFAGVPTGGPYRLNATVKVGGAEKTATVEPIFVGDLWVLAGQSNMQGIGELIDVVPPHPKVTALEMPNSNWVQAKEPLHWWWIDKERQKTRPTGAGLAMSFAVTVVEKTNIPIGLLPCAVGGTYMTQWDPALKSKGRGSLYGAMLDQVNKTGGKVKGLLWYHGEAESSLAASKIYPQVFTAFIAAVRKDFNQPDLPFYLVQIGRVVGDTRVGGDPTGWNAVRETQRLIPEQVPNTAVVSVIDAELDDFIHIGTQGLKRAGKRLALIALGDLYGQAKATTPNLESVVKGPNDTLLVKFKGVNLHGPGKPGLRPARHIAGFSIRGKDGAPFGFIYDAAVGPDPQTVTLKLVPHKKFPVEGFLWYGYGLDPYCNLTDGLDMAALAFGPIALDGIK